MAKKIVFTGGGTVGHVTLNLILIPKFIKDGWEVHYIGDKHGIEHEQIEKSGLDVTFHSIATGKLRRLEFFNQLQLSLKFVRKPFSQKVALYLSHQSLRQKHLEFLFLCTNLIYQWA
mgnify:CR=1 FL=1